MCNFSVACRLKFQGHHIKICMDKVIKVTLKNSVRGRDESNKSISLVKQKKCNADMWQKLLIVPQP